MRKEREREVVWRRERTKVDEEGRRRLTKKVVEDVMDSHGQPEEQRRKRPRTIQIFVTVDGSEALPLELSPSDKVSDIMSVTADGTCKGRVIRRSDEVQGCVVGDGSAVRASPVVEESTRTRRAQLKRNRPPAQRDQSRRARKNRRAIKVQRFRSATRRQRSG